MKYRRIFESGHSYYFTLVTYRRKPYLVEYIEQLREAFRYSKTRYDYRIDAIVVLPDHLHMIITPKCVQQYPEIIKQIKRSFVYNLPSNVKQTAKLELSHSQYKRRHSGIWQSRYYEHVIRNEKDFYEKMQYIQNNPIKHGLCKPYNTWKYSSFYHA
jgi:putative transposase